MSSFASDTNSPNPERTLSPEAAAVSRARLTPLRGRERYEITGELGKGGMGIVLAVRESSTDRCVAMKVLNPDAVSDDRLTRFVEEARITAQLEHPNIVPVHELGFDSDQRVFYTMKLVEGATLQQVIEDLARGDSAVVKAYSLPELLTVFQKLCDAVSFAHSRQVIHRDLKPANIMLGRHGEVLLMDWGLAKRLDQPNSSETVGQSSPDPSIGLTKLGTLLGSPLYMAPEQARTEGDGADQRTDIYALGAILFSILSGRSPVDGNTVEEVLANVREGRMAKLPPAIPPSLAAVVARATAQSKRDRYQTVAELKREIAAYQSGFATTAGEATLFRQILLAVRRHRREAAVALAACLLLVGVVSIAFFHIAAERQRANDALQNLSQAAPLFIAHARSLAAQGRFDEALRELDYASELQPTNRAALHLKSSLLETRLRFAQAAETLIRLAQVDPADGGVRHRLALASDLAKMEIASNAARERRLSLLQVMCSDNRPVLEIAPLLRVHQVPEHLVQSLSNSPEGLSLSLSNAQPQDLLSLQDVPLASLALTRSPKLRDLSFVRGMPLVALNLSECDQLRDLEPLRGLPLRSLNIKNCISVTNLAPISSSPLEFLYAFHATGLTDLSPLRHLPLRVLDLREAKNVTGIAPLAKAPLEEIYLYQSGVKTLEQLAPLAQLINLQVLDLSGTDLNDLNKIPRDRLRILRIGRTQVTDFSPIAGSPIEVLHADSLPGPVDLAPLLECRSLRWLVVPQTAKNPGILRGHRSLQKASYGFHSESEPKQLLDEFLMSLGNSSSASTE